MMIDVNSCFPPLDQTHMVHGMSKDHNPEADMNH
jgi:hypothetical protein